jgi:hypothetical protein
MVEGGKRGREEIREEEGGGRENQLTSQNQVLRWGVEGGDKRRESLI